MSTPYKKKSTPNERVFFIFFYISLGFLLNSCGSSLIIPNTGGDNEVPPSPTPADFGTVPIIVKDEHGEAFTDGVIIRLSDSSEVDSFDNNGVKVSPCNPPKIISAWKMGYYAGFQPCDGRITQYEIQLVPLRGSDNPNYQWNTAKSNCINCHAGQINGTYNEVFEWINTRHAKVFEDKFFESMYRGTNLGGVSSPQTDWMLMDNELVRIPPNTNSEYRGPGFKLDFPQQPGNCAFCHAPAAILNTQTSVDMTPLFSRTGDAVSEGITCDVCHKVLNVALADNGLPFTDRPGVLSFEYLRPTDGALYIGPFSNINVGGSASIGHQVTCSPVFSKSEFCASCHYGKFGNTVIYNSYGEWKQSKYGDNPNEPDYKTCQDCHMSHMNVNQETPPSNQRQACSESATGFQNFDHNLMDFGMDEDLQKDIPRMIRNAAQIKVEFQFQPDKKDSLDVIVKATNTKAGHKFPTDSPLRHLILVVDARDQLGTSLMRVDGETIPIWGGTGRPEMDQKGIKNYGGLPGKIFANVLVEEHTNISPTAAYWNNTTLAWISHNPETNSDTRLEPNRTDTSRYSFFIPPSGQVTITARLVYRFAFFDLMVQKDWVRPDIIVTTVECTGNPKNVDTMKCNEVVP